jgi:Ca-activated chloride channel family protein
VSTLGLVHPEWLVAVVAVGAASVLALVFARTRARMRRRCLGPALRPGISLGRDGALLLALAAVGAALLGPRLGENEVRVPASGVDVVLLFDVSRSMDARDVAPSRLARARRAGEELLARLLPGDRAALAFFAERGVLAAPLSPDRDAIAQLVGALDSALLRPAGSSLASGIRVAAEAFEPGSERPRAIFVLSDGEDPERRGELGIAAARSADAAVFAAAFGSDAGATVPDRGLPLRDRDGAVVLSRRNSQRLERLAAATGGELFRADEWGDFDFEAAVAALRRGGVADATGMTTRRVSAVRIWPCAALAFALLALEGLPLTFRRATGLRIAGLAAVGPRIAGLASAGPRIVGLAAVGLLLSGAGGGDPVELAAALREQPGEPRLLIELGLDRLDRGRRADAMRAFRAAAVGARDPALAALAWYDLGVAALEEGSLEQAKHAFFDALALDPRDRQARFNLEWTLAALKHEPAPPPPREESPPEPVPEAADEPGADGEADAPHETSAEQRRRWLERVEDDLGRALQAAAAAGAPRRSSGPAW